MPNVTLQDPYNIQRHRRSDRYYPSAYKVLAQLTLSSATLDSSTTFDLNIMDGYTVSALVGERFGSIFDDIFVCDSDGMGVHIIFNCDTITYTVVPQEVSF